MCMKAVSCPIFQRTCAPICHFGIEFRFFTSDRNEVEQETRRGRPGALVMSVGAVNWAVVLVVAPVVCLFVCLLFALSSLCWYWPKVPAPSPRACRTLHVATLMREARQTQIQMLHKKSRTCKVIRFIRCNSNEAKQTVALIAYPIYNRTGRL